MLFEDLSLSKVYKEPYMNKATPTQPHTRTINPTSFSRKGFNVVRKQELENAAFAIPIYTNCIDCRILKESQTNLGIDCNSTRELAVQIGQSFDTYGKYI
jgi:ATP-dependent RNA helicase RhlE